ncbi:MAG: hypothetical protein GVY18_04720 [Bacteroidetes bacterium]|jgi:hypothetical protein|nr:hypothetical protein [Bacteroidota bacterium]
MKGFPLALLLTGLLLWSACDDASTVGVDLVGEQGAPTTERLDLATLSSVPYDDVTGGATRLLTGDVDDPALGRITATSFLDLSGTFGAPGDSTIQEVSLRLAPDYVYGDTTATLTLALAEVLDMWDDEGLTADTTLSTAATPLTETSFVPTDSLVTLTLPDTWIAENGDLFTGDDFEDAFVGFALQSTTPGAVVGFSASASELRVVTPSDTIEYQITKTLSTLGREGSPALPPDQTLLQDGVGPTVQFDLDLSSFADTPLNGAVIRFFTRSETLGTLPPHFVRPTLDRVQIVLVDEDDGEPVELELDDEAIDEDGTLSFSSAALRELFQQTTFGEDLYDALELRVAPSDNSISPLLLYTPEAADDLAPEVLLTISPADQ